ncbi:uncharacterized protein METZ01_LOCUS215834, partial [marine metagenome]
LHEGHPTSGHRPRRIADRSHGVLETERGQARLLDERCLPPQRIRTPGIRRSPVSRVRHTRPWQPRVSSVLPM